MLIFMMLSHVYLRVKFGETLDFVSHIKNFTVLLARGPPVLGSRSKIWEIKYQGLKTAHLITVPFGGGGSAFDKGA